MTRPKGPTTPMRQVISACAFLLVVPENRHQVPVFINWDNPQSKRANLGDTCWPDGRETASKEQRWVHRKDHNAAQGGTETSHEKSTPTITTLQTRQATELLLLTSKYQLCLLNARFVPFPPHNCPRRQIFSTSLSS